jgi:hypothetical protein
LGELDGGTAPVEAAVFLAQRGRARGETVLLRGGDQRAGEQAGEGLDEQAGAKQREARGELAAVLLRLDRRPGGGQNRSRVEPRIHAHERHTGPGRSGEERVRDRTRSPPRGQERGVQVDAAETGQSEEIRREDLAERGDDDQIGRQLAKERHLGRGAQSFRGPHRNTQACCGDPHRRIGRLPSTAGRAGRTRDDESGRVTGRSEGFEAGNGEARGAGENQPGERPGVRDRLQPTRPHGRSA